MSDETEVSDDAVNLYLAAKFKEQRQEILKQRPQSQRDPETGDETDRFLVGGESEDEVIFSSYFSTFFLIFVLLAQVLALLTISPVLFNLSNEFKEFDSVWYSWVPGVHVPGMVYRQASKLQQDSGLTIVLRLLAVTLLVVCMSLQLKGHLDGLHLEEKDEDMKRKREDLHSKETCSQTTERVLVRGIFIYVYECLLFPALLILAGTDKIIVCEPTDVILSSLTVVFIAEMDNLLVKALFAVTFEDQSKHFKVKNAEAESKITASASTAGFAASMALLPFFFAFFGSVFNVRNPGARHVSKYDDIDLVSFFNQCPALIAGWTFICWGCARLKDEKRTTAEGERSKAEQTKNILVALNIVEGIVMIVLASGMTIALLRGRPNLLRNSAWVCAVVFGFFLSLKLAFCAAMIYRKSSHISEPLTPRHPPSEGGESVKTTKSLKNAMKRIDDVVLDNQSETEDLVATLVPEALYVVAVFLILFWYHNGRIGSSSHYAKHGSDHGMPKEFNTPAIVGVCVLLAVQVITGFVAFFLRICIGGGEKERNDRTAVSPL
uniref:Uncharacterized protein n=1 Tax=Chromera velia CCMP2878 TaxID=1169474 RepID=A0A0G4HAI4_9ALVE|eukprot:Cvel_6040.t1-p1 / transcript=Cvel_6040.t1 / gene=Cvel_6040 / organism=Chromera_velia_CCMP2878 / gene_product=hypothetical protein / transcript_product=hypothetical protein / location=Cvel_scaffold290:15405-18270(+) / protein_length=549 / sequence_SO=supercontig / SO=protein_coding / is_pseudo=false